MRLVLELVSKLPTALEESFIGRSSIVSENDYERLLEDQRTQMSTISRLMQAYTSLTQSYQKLSESYGKIKRK